MKQRVAVYLMGGFLLLPNSVWAASGTAGAAFLDIPVGAGPAALGGAYSSLAADAYAPIYNPAGLGFLSGSEFSAQHLSYLESINYEFASFVHPLGSKEHSYGGIGAAVQYLSPGDVTARDETGNLAGEFSGHYAAYTLSYGYAPSSRWGLGLTGKIISAKIDNAEGTAYAGDLGSYVKLTSNWTAAATLTNVGSHLTLLQDGQVLPTTTHLGTNYKLGDHWIFSAEGAFPAHDSAGFLSGVQWQPVDFLELRAGYRTDTIKNNSAEAGVSVGAGINLWGQEFAYAWLPYGDLGSSQYFSLLLRFGRAANGPKIMQQQADNNSNLSNEIQGL